MPWRRPVAGSPPPPPLPRSPWSPPSGPRSLPAPSLPGPPSSPASRLGSSKLRRMATTFPFGMGMIRDALGEPPQASSVAWYTTRSPCRNPPWMCSATVWCTNMSLPVPSAVTKPNASHMPRTVPVPTPGPAAARALGSPPAASPPVVAGWVAVACADSGSSSACPQLAVAASVALLAAAFSYSSSTSCNLPTNCIMLHVGKS